MNTAPRSKNKLERTYTCSVCNVEYTTVRYSTKRFCSDRCRMSSARLKVASKRVDKLPVSEEWLWVASECKRAGTVEILHGHTVATLEQLFSLRNYRYRCFGWDAERKTSKYHLCHIQPANGTSRVGLLHPHNLFVGGSLANQVHGTKSYANAGLSIARISLKPRWLVDKDTSDKVVLDKVTRFLGSVLIEFAKTNPIRMSQRLSLARWVHKNISNCGFTLHELERKGIAELRKMRADFEEKELYQMDVTAKRSIIVYMDECKRLSNQLPESQHKSDLTALVPVLNIATIWLAGEDGEHGLGNVLAVPFHVHWKPLQLRPGQSASTFRDFVSFQAFQALQGAPVDIKMVLSTLRKYLYVDSLVPDWSKYPEGCYRYFKVEYDTFRPQIPVVQNAILSIGLANPVQVQEFLDSVKTANAELEWYESHEWAVGLSEHDYSGVQYEVEDDYTPNPNLRVAKEYVYVGF
jgi:hypothetical protein